MQRALAISLVFALAGNTPATAKPPTLDSLFPAGGCRGATVTVTAAGSFGHWPVKVWTEGRGIEVAALPEKGKLSITIASDARVGVHRFRLFDEEGATDLRPFLVGTLPEVLEAEPNDDPIKPQRLDNAAVTINGKLGRGGDVDGFAVPLRKGETLVAALEANRRLGAPMDGLLQLASAAGFVLAQNDDAPDRDPRIIFDAPSDGTYLIRAFAFPAEPDQRIGFAGGDAYIYRLTLTTGGFLDHVYPLSVRRGSPGRVEAFGWNIPESARSIEVGTDHDATKSPEEAEGETEPVAVGHGLLANVGEVWLEAHPAASEVEPNPPERPQDVTLPSTISGRIDPPRDQDVYRFAAKKGDKWLIKVESRTLGRPLDPVLRVLDTSGKVLNEVDDAGRRRSATRDPELNFAAPEDGAYRIVVRDLNGEGSFQHVYRLTVAPPKPDFSLNLAADRFTITPGKPLKIPLTVQRDNEFGSSIAVEAVGLPEGVNAPQVASAPKGESAKGVTLELSASQGPWSGPFRIVGRAAEGDSRSRTARAPLGNVNGTTEHIWLTVLKPAPAPPAGDAPAEKKDKP